MRGLTFLGSMKLTMPSGGGSPYRKRVAATACRISSDARPASSLRKIELTHAPAHRCLTYSAMGHDDPHTAFAGSPVTKQTQLPGGMYWSLSGDWQL